MPIHTHVAYPHIQIAHYPQGPEHNVYEKMPEHYPYVETKMAPDQSDDDYPAWKNGGGVKEHNVFADYQFPNY
jgi:hypothetical protein